jgi:hypothetical protein
MNDDIAKNGHDGKVAQEGFQAANRQRSIDQVYQTAKEA